MGEPKQPVWKKINSPVGMLVSAVVLGIFDQLVTFVVNKITSEKTLSFTWDMLVWLWDIAWTQIPVPAWLLVALSGIVFLFIAVLFYVRFIEPRDTFDPNDWHNYTEDNMYGCDWRWTYDGDTLNSPRPYCPRCQGTMQASLGREGLICHNNDYRLDFPDGIMFIGEFRAKAGNEVQRRIRTQEFIQIVKRQRSELEASNE